MTVRLALRESTLAAIFAAALAAGACRSGHGTPAPEYPMFLDVDNRSLFEVDVYALPSLSSTPRVRLGSVTSFSTVTLPVRRTDLRSDQTLVLFLHAIGSSSSWVSPGVVLDRGVRACLEIIGDMSGYLGRSSLSSMTTDDSVAAGKPLCMHGAMEGARAAGLGGKGGN